MKKIINKTVNLDLVDVNGNAFMIMSVFSRQAKRENWTQDEINTVITEANRLKDYDHLIETIKSYCEVKEEVISSNELSKILKQLGLFTHYLATKDIAIWDTYDHSNYRALQRKAGRIKKVFAIFDADVSNEDKYIVTTKPAFFFESEDEAMEELERICIERKRDVSDFVIHPLCRLPK